MPSNPPVFLSRYGDGVWQIYETGGTSRSRGRLLISTSDPYFAAQELLARLRLTEREAQIAKAMALSSKSLREIGDALGLSEHTVNKHRSNIYEKLGVHDRTQLLLYLQAAGVAPAPKAGRWMEVYQQ